MDKQTKTERVGEVRRANNGQLMKIIGYKNANNIDIQFEDGTIVKDRTYKMFKKGGIKNPNITDRRKRRVSGTDILLSEYRLHEVNTASNGQEMKIIHYRDVNDIDIQFEDGTIVRHKAYGEFKDGYIKNPSVTELDMLRKQYIGNIRMSKCGMRLKIVDVHSVDDMDIIFEDGSKVSGVPRSKIQNGTVYPGGVNGYVYNARKEYIGKTNINASGLVMKIIEYDGTSNVKIQFEDGAIKIAKHQAFKDGQVLNIMCPNCTHYRGEYYGFNILGYAFKEEDTGLQNFICSCNKCMNGDTVIMNVREMYQHEEKCTGPQVRELRRKISEEAIRKSKGNDKK